MECNKEEAVRAREISEQKIQNGDIEGAKKFALKAQKLFPELENISQLLTVCNVHYSATNKLSGLGMDWYGILQIEQSADETSIKKQYRKLALLLHPDKNKFAGAEAAFKLIGEANMILSDQTKRSQYDLKYRISVKTAPESTSRRSKKASVSGQSKSSNNSQNGSSKSTASYGYQQAQQQAFWTLCSACGVKYQYLKEFVNRLLHCPTCGFHFIAFDLGPQGPCNTGVQFQHGVAGSAHVPQAGNSHEDFTVKQKADEFPNTGDEKKGGDMPMPNASEPKGSGTSRNGKKRRKPVEVSDESRETETADAVGSEGCCPNSKANASHPPRKSSKQKPITDYFSWQKRA
ncbi:hypothetical protein like AT3G04980 [Hibiscus trionum]|uniref:J domain-containing protein n=1 Tax=Hibiscus trionum TaxID=183268 RepID=A0A9W7LI89_HIBTR|nr:hypothetical protein like AT3G04980 [Hibiscus trionum]